MHACLNVGYRGKSGSGKIHEVNFVYIIIIVTALFALKHIYHLFFRGNLSRQFSTCIGRLILLDSSFYWNLVRRVQKNNWKDTVTKRCFQLSFTVKELKSTSLQNKNIANQKWRIQTESLVVVLQ